MIRSYFYHYNDVYIAVKGKIFLAVPNKNDIAQIDITFKNNTPFTS